MKNFKKLFFLFLFSFFSFSFLIGNAQVYTISSKINLDWEVLNSYTPPFYEGKTLAGEQADIKVVADVEILTPVGLLDPKKLFYVWTYNNFYVHNYTKTGGNIAYFTLDKLVSENVINLKVYEKNTKENLLIQKTLYISPKKSLPILYRKNSSPIITYANAINKKYQHYNVKRGESFEILAEPYFFSAKSANDPSLDYIWSLNGIPGNTNYSNTYEYKAPVNAYADFGVGVTISHSTKVLQRAESLLNFVFKEE